MKKRILLAGLLAAACGAHATLVSYSQDSLNTAIPDASPVGITSTINVSGIADVDADNNSTIQNVDVRLNITGGYNGDIYGYLVLQNVGGTTTSILLNRVGTAAGNPFGSSASGFDVTLSGSSTADIHTSGVNSGTLTGLWGADGRVVDPNTVTDQSPQTAALDVFNGKSANGTWTLFLADLAGGDQSTLVGWDLDISVVPEPVTWALVGFALILGSVRFVAWRTQRAATA